MTCVLRTNLYPWCSAKLLIKLHGRVPTPNFMARGASFFQCRYTYYHISCSGHGCFVLGRQRSVLNCLRWSAPESVHIRQLESVSLRIKCLLGDSKLTLWLTVGTTVTFWGYLVVKQERVLPQCLSPLVLAQTSTYASRQPTRPV